MAVGVGEPNEVLREGAKAFTHSREIDCAEVGVCDEGEVAGTDLRVLDANRRSNCKAVCAEREVRRFRQEGTW